MKSKDIPKLIITEINNWSYFQWFLLGFYELENDNLIRLKFSTDFVTKISTIINSSVINHIVRIIFGYKNGRFLKGYVEYRNKKISFCIDNIDTPYLFDTKLLKECDAYFKMQCPKEFNPKGFRLGKDVYVPFSDIRESENETPYKQNAILDFENYIHKIKPLLNACRYLSPYNNTHKGLKREYDKYIKLRKNSKDYKLMTYFGNAKGPELKNINTKIDLNSESDIMTYFNARLDHPNEKRAVASDFISTLGEMYDARVINNDSISNWKLKANKSLVIPLSEFNSHVAKFQYNLNISGYRMSIPSRLIESFVVGTAVITDKLSVKWYLPFEEELIETVEMGYLKNYEVDWNRFKRDVENLPYPNKDHIIGLYEKKWAPKVVAEYIVNTLLESK